MSEKKWKITMPNLRKWAEGRTFRLCSYTDFGKVWSSVDFVRYIQLIENGQAIEFANSEGDYGDISREVLEKLALEGYGYDSEYGIDYYTVEEYERREREGEDL